MNFEQYVLARIAEEAGEIAQAAQKAMIFGLEDGEDHTGRTNAEHLIREAVDLTCFLEVLGDHTRFDQLIPDDQQETIINEQIEERRQKINTYFNRSIERGHLDGSTVPDSFRKEFFGD